MTSTQTENLQPPFIGSFFLGLPRRLEEVITRHRDDQGELDDESITTLNELLQAVTDRLDALLTTAMALGYPPVTDLDVSTLNGPSDLNTDAVTAASKQLGQQISGTPISAWARHPEELDELRVAVSDIAELLRGGTSTLDDETAD